MLQSVWHILLALAPWLFVGAAIAGALHALVPPDFLRRSLTGRWGVVNAAAIGVPMPLCSCSVIPVGMSLRSQGASAGATVAFLVSTPETGVDSILVSAGFLGWKFAVFKFVSAFAIGLAAGVLTNALVPATQPLPVLAAGVTSHRRGFRGMFEHSLESLHALWGWLVIGVLVSALIETLLPPGGLEHLGAYGGAAAMGAALLIGMPLYVCALASVPIAAALVNNGFPPGAALVFLIAGPATNVSTMGAVYRILGGRTLAIYLATIAVGSVACGLTFDGLLDAPSTAVAGHVHRAPSWWAAGSAAALMALIAWFAVSDVRRWIRGRSAARRAAPRAAVRQVQIGVEGMTCNNCVARLERVLAREPGVSHVAVTLEPGRAVVEGDVAEPRVRELIAAAGFEPR